MIFETKRAIDMLLIKATKYTDFYPKWGQQSVLFLSLRQRGMFSLMLKNEENLKTFLFSLGPGQKQFLSIFRAQTKLNFLFDDCSLR